MMKKQTKPIGHWISFGVLATAIFISASANAEDVPKDQSTRARRIELIKGIASRHRMASTAKPAKAFQLVQECLPPTLGSITELFEFATMVLCDELGESLSLLVAAKPHANETCKEAQNEKDPRPGVDLLRNEGCPKIECDRRNDAVGNTLCDSGIHRAPRSAS